MYRWGSLMCLVAIACGGGGGGGGDGAGEKDGGNGPEVDAGTIDDLVSPSADDSSGTRLKRRLYVTEDGFEVQVGWYDAQLGVNCAFGDASDGSVRCIPRTFRSGIAYYRDDACTDPVFGLGAGLANGDWFYTSDPTACHLRLWTVDQAIAEPGTLYQVQTAGCAAVTPVTEAFYEATETGPTDMVEEIISHEPAGSRLMSRIRSTSDGARRYRGMYDSQLDSMCFDAVAEDGTVRCGPVAEASETSSNEFADETCTVELDRYRACQTIPLYRLSYIDAPSACPGRLDFVERTIYTGTVYSNFDGCQVSEPSDAYTYVLDGEPIAASAMVAQTATGPSQGSTRLRSALIQYQDGSVDDKRARFDQVFDSKHQVVCEFREIESGAGIVERCLPADYLDVEDVFADSGCTEHLAVESRPCEEERRPGFARLREDIFYRVTGEFAGATVYLGDSTECVATPVPDGVYLFTLDQTPVTDWESVTEVVEP